LPADANERDNTAYFVYQSATALRASIVSRDNASARLLRLAALASSTARSDAVSVRLPSELDQAGWADQALLVWQEPLPQGELAQRLKAFIEEGGVVAFFPPGKPDPGQFLELGWGDVEDAPEENAFRVESWEENEGPLARTQEGFSLPVGKVQFQKRQAIRGNGKVLAQFADGAPLLIRRAAGQGQAVFCASLPREDWSSLGDGPVLVPMMQRLLQAGALRQNRAAFLACGTLSPAERERAWTSLDSAEPKQIQTQAGVYQAGDRHVAVNRPPRENEPGIMAVDDARRLFGTVPFQILEERERRTGQVHGEVWRIFLLAMLAFLLVEGWLILPERTAAPARTTKPAGAPAEAMTGQV
jgi:hypothetical protein